MPQPFVSLTSFPEPSLQRAVVRDAIRADETQTVMRLAAQAELAQPAQGRVAERARKLVEVIRAERAKSSGIDAFMHEYELSSKEGIALMCLAEALLRIPDGETRDALIRDKIGKADWTRHAGHSQSTFVNASTWALMLTGRVVNMDRPAEDKWWSVLRRLVHRAGEPVIREAVEQAMRIMGRQFVLGQNIDDALRRARDGVKRGYRYSFDMLGEGAKTMADAQRYFDNYKNAIRAIGGSGEAGPVFERPNISVKLSALHPRYEAIKHERVMIELLPQIAALAAEAKAVNIGLCIDAEEVDRLDLSLDIMEALALREDLRGWDGLGLAIQAYQKRCYPLIDWLADLARRSERRLMVRLVKGAYWDAEIKHAQELGLDGYPVFTRKVSTDVSYLACARKLLSDRRAFYPCFATHNAHSVAHIMEIANGAEFEFQRLHGMGDALYGYLLNNKVSNPSPVRVYAPVGSHEDLLPYLVRRLLENGANSSFVNRIVDEELPIEEIIADPAERVTKLVFIPNPRIPLPEALFPDGRRNSAGLDLTHVPTLTRLKKSLEGAATSIVNASALVGFRQAGGTPRNVTYPADRREIIGTVREALAKDALEAIEIASRAQESWDRTGAETRASILERASDLFEDRRDMLLALLVQEGGKTLPDAVAEFREAVDFLRYYAALARKDFSTPIELPGPTGERNTIALHGRGVFLCISPWNFPLAIFTGQVAAALAAGNSVLAKPAEQTPLVAFEAIRLLREAGVPAEVLHFLPGDGPEIGNALLGHPALSGVSFTGSTETAQIINRALAARNGPIVPLIAETGGQNAMVVDSSALPEQVTRDVLTSAFQSAGQRCSALRVLFMQEDIAEKMIGMIAGAMAELRIGDPRLIETDVGPVIDEEAKNILDAHAERMLREAKLIYRTNLGPECARGSFFAPQAYEITDIRVLEREVFGPILHVIRFNANRLNEVATAINSAGYGLTAAIHSRVEATIDYFTSRIRAGNVYVNRSQIGAVVGVQPFGGEGLSGTGPKAGGPRYLHRFAVERTVSVDTTASGGNAALMAANDLE